MNAFSNIPTDLPRYLLLSAYGRTALSHIIIGRFINSLLRVTFSFFLIRHNLASRQLRLFG